MFQHTIHDNIVEQVKHSYYFNPVCPLAYYMDFEDTPTCYRRDSVY